jgi:hypothetical protein
MMQPATKKRHFWPALTLFFLAPAIGELLSGSSPPAEFFNPFTLFLLAALYGSGALLIRELRIRWNKGWPTVLLLGAAYAIVEEGWLVKSFFNPNWVDIGLLGSYGRWAGVNWVWCLHLTNYHAVFSISIPILLVELLFPGQRAEPWVGRKGQLALGLLLLGDVLLGFFFLTPYRPPAIAYLLSILAVIFLYRLAQKLPARITHTPDASDRPAARLRWFRLVGFAATLALFIIDWGWPALHLPVLLTILANIGLVAMVIWSVRWLSHHGAWGDEQRLALASGALFFFVLLAPLQQLDSTRPDNTTGMTLVGLAALTLIVWLWRRVHSNKEVALTV